MQYKNRKKVDGLESKLMAVTNQLLDLGKRNRLLNYRDTGLKSLRLLNKNTEEIFRSVKAYRDLKFFDTDAALTAYISDETIPDKIIGEDLLHLEFPDVYSVCRKSLANRELLAYKQGYQVQRVLKSLNKDSRSSLIEKGINPLYISFGFIYYIENEITFAAPLLLIEPVNVDESAR